MLTAECHHVFRDVPPAFRNQRYTHAILGELSQLLLRINYVHSEVPLKLLDGAEVRRKLIYAINNPDCTKGDTKITVPAL
jgi:hypothetical protein